jgi:hypothetical protein
MIYCDLWIMIDRWMLMGRWIVVYYKLLFGLCFAGTCITFLIIIGDQFDRAFASLVGPDFCHTWYLNRLA